MKVVLSSVFQTFLWRGPIFANQVYCGPHSEVALIFPLYYRRSMINATQNNLALAYQQDAK